MSAPKKPTTAELLELLAILGGPTDEEREEFMLADAEERVRRREPGIYRR